MTRRQRQLDELRALCASGAIGRAIDLAYEHFADFGPDDDITNLITAAIAEATNHGEAVTGVRRRFAELSASLRCEVVDD